MKFYRVETQQAYDELMIELEEKGCKWRNGKKPTQLAKFKNYGKDTYIFDESGVLSFSDGEYFKKYHSDEPVIEYKAKKQLETNDFIKELTVKIYYNEITKKHYNSYDDAISDCKREMERQHDKN